MSLLDQIDKMTKSQPTQPPGAIQLEPIVHPRKKKKKRRPPAQETTHDLNMNERIREETHNFPQTAIQVEEPTAELEANTPIIMETPTQIINGNQMHNQMADRMFETTPLEQENIPKHPGKSGLFL